MCSRPFDLKFIRPPGSCEGVDKTPLFCMKTLAHHGERFSFEILIMSPLGQGVALHVFCDRHEGVGWGWVGWGGVGWGEVKRGNAGGGGEEVKKAGLLVGFFLLLRRLALIVI